MVISRGCEEKENTGLLLIEYILFGITDNTINLACIVVLNESEVVTTIYFFTSENRI